MVAALRPGKFYGRSLPRPRFYSNVKFSSERVDPPVSVSDPLLCWANEAHWSMGGLSFKRLRSQGRIDGSIKKLRAETIKSAKKEEKIRLTAEKVRLDAEKIRNIEEDEFMESESEPEDEFEVQVNPEAEKKMARKLVDEFEVQVNPEAEKKMARKLVDEFDEVADSPLNRTGCQTRGKRSGSDKRLGKNSASNKTAVKRSRSVKKSQVNSSPEI